MENYRIKYDYWAYLFLKEYCVEEPKVVIETNLGPKGTLTYGHFLLNTPNTFALYGLIEGPDFGKDDKATVYPDGSTHVARSSKMGSYYVELGTAYIEWTK